MLGAIAKWDDAVLPEDSYALAFAPTGCRLAVTRNKAVAFLDDPTRPKSLEYPLTSDWSAAVAFVPGADLAVVGTNSFLDFMNPCGRRSQRASRPACAPFWRSPYRRMAGRSLLAASRGLIEVYDVASRTRTTAYDFGIGGIYALAFAPDGLTFAAGGDKGLVVCDHSG